VAIDRRSFLKASAAQAALLGAAVGSGVAGCATHAGAPAIPRGVNPFRHGVASGDPLADRVMLWTRVSPFEDRLGEPIETHWWISRDTLGLEVIDGGTVQALPEKDYTVKVDAGGLEPGTDYYYGFMSLTGLSPIGRTRTLPGVGVDGVRLAFASCANYPNGFFNAYACIAEREDLDVVLHLGDYLYEYGNGEYGDGTALDRIPDPLHEILNLEDYRRRHATYKRDPDLQAAHARHPWITIWDDHESANNSSPVGAENHDPATEGDWTLRKLAAIRAYYEWMPIRELPRGLFRQFAFGDLFDLIMLDTRLHGRDPEAALKDNAAADDPARTLLGADQRQWLFDALSESQRGPAKWRVIGQQIMVAPVSFNGTDFNPDSWNGYRADRDRLLDYLVEDGIDNVVFLTGDVHSSWVYDIPPPKGRGPVYNPATGAGSRAVEFVGPAVSSPALGSGSDWSERAAKIDAQTPHLQYWNLEEQGFVILDVTRKRVRAEYMFTALAATRSKRARCGPVFEARAGSNHAIRLDDATCDA
jgi:alkaline phosphatase D